MFHGSRKAVHFWFAGVDIFFSLVVDELELIVCKLITEVLGHAASFTCLGYE
jgi:hypothetical protein